MERVKILLIPLLITVTAVLGCRVTPQGQGNTITRNFTVGGFRLPTAMVFTTSASAPTQLPGGIASTSEGAKSFVSRLVMQMQGRRAGLPDGIISQILNQLAVQISYDPLECKTVTINKPANMECRVGVGRASVDHYV
ncbi:hypothetical protein KIN20_023566 [Parelaphostrongylus tenuis]|uniref:Lipoprotein n=1 Tax=Parelaphostrongylus tenuis TaxID=148309 RepID=A0AAD5N6N9_PARTN|nr:hypothetical protein KIN20_023566 [Parelaphostrongylus tenuis]